MSRPYQLSVNLPRWGLKQMQIISQPKIVQCKFTPLGFETQCKNWVNPPKKDSVNLPRWGLKPSCQTGSQFWYKV